ncbi:MAG: glycosyltransferase family 4 protein [Phycisphaerae bacterium]
MKIAITNPTTWPRVRRGAERFLNELACYLAQRGHDVTVVACKAGPRQITRQRGYRTDCHRRIWHPVLGRIGVLEFHAFLATSLIHLLGRRYDIVHCCTFTDAYAAGLARRVTGVPYVFWVNGIPAPVPYIRSVSLGSRVFRRSICNADEVISLSKHMHDYFEGRFGRGGVTIPVPVDVETFRLSRRRDHDRPIILCAAALEDARKGGRFLMRAFDILKQSCGTAVLQLSSPISDRTRSELLGLVSQRWRRDVHFLGTGHLAELPELFGRAAISVLPSLWEAFGMVILESMSTGTPVVGTRDGAIPELITTPDVGRLFEPGPTTTEPTNVEGLVQAMTEGLELSRRYETAERCRAHAEQYSWAAVGPRFEELYERLINGASREAGAPCLPGAGD